MNKKSKNLLRTTLRDVMSYKFSILFFLVLSVIAAVIAVICPGVFGQAIDVVVEGVSSTTIDIDFDKLGKMLTAAVLLYILLFIVQLILKEFGAYFTQKFTFNMRTKLFAKIGKLPFSYYEENKTGDILSIFVNDVENFCQYFLSTLEDIFTAALTIIAVFVAMLVISPQLTLAVFIITILSFLSIIVLFRVSQKYFNLQQDKLGDMNAYVEETLSGFEIVKAYKNEEETYEYFKKINESLSETGRRASILSGIDFPIVNSAFCMSFFAIAILGLFLVIIGQLTIGGIQAFIMYTKACTNPIITLTNISSSIQKMYASARRIYAFLDEEEMDLSNIEPLNKQIENIDIVDMYFGYDDKELVLKDINLHIRPGEKVAIVGPTGSGKTTLAKLLVNFHDPTSGVISINNKSMVDINKHDLRNHVGMVSQFDYIFEGSIADNISFVENEYNLSKVEYAAHIVGADKFIEKLPDKYDTMLNGESEVLSQGQKQLISIARALYSDKELLIFDEATSCLDADIEMILMKLYEEIFNDKTVITIAHRLSTIKSADKIIVLKDGEIFEMGTHKELIAYGGYYASMLS